MKPQELKQFKKEMGWTWDKMAEKLGVQPRTVYSYLDETNGIPETVAKLIRAYKILKLKGLKRFI